MSFCFTVRICSLWGGVNQHLESGNRSPKNLGIEAQKIWNLGTEKISGIWDVGEHNYQI